QQVAVLVERQAVRQGAAVKPRGGVLGGEFLICWRLGDDLLGAVGTDADDTSSGVRRPQRPVGFGPDAFGPLEVMPGEGEVVAGERETVGRVGGHRPLTAGTFAASRAVRFRRIHSMIRSSSSSSFVRAQ